MSTHHTVMQLYTISLPAWMHFSIAAITRLKSQNWRWPEPGELDEDNAYYQVTGETASRMANWLLGCSDSTNEANPNSREYCFKQANQITKTVKPTWSQLGRSHATLAEATHTANP